MMEAIDLTRAAVLPPMGAAPGMSYELLVMPVPPNGVANLSLKAGARIHSVVPLPVQQGLVGAGRMSVLVVVELESPLAEATG